MRATGHEIKRTAVFLARGVAAGFEALGPAGTALRNALRRLGAMLVRLVRLVIAAVAAGVALTGRALVTLDRIVTPRRALLFVALSGSVLLAVSQFTDFRATEIGQPGYAGIEDVATAPRVDVSAPTGSHSVLLLIGAVLGAGAVAGAILTGRRSWGLVVAAVGGVTVLVSLAIDLPNGLDLGEAGISYSGVSAVLLSGFWIQLAAGVTLVSTGLLLLAGPAGKPSPAARPRHARGERPSRGRQPSTANGSKS